MSTRNTLDWNGIDDFYLHDVVLSNVSANKFIFFFFCCCWFVSSKVSSTTISYNEELKHRCEKSNNS